MTAQSVLELAGEQRLLRGFPAKEFFVERAANATLWTTDGRQFTDLGGASHGVAVVGHNHPRVVAEIQRQSARLIHVAQGIQTPERAAFLEALHGRLPSQLARSFLANSGAEAMECALKMASVATGRSRFVAANDSFHGRTTGALGVTHRPGFRDPFQAILPDCDFVPFNDQEALKQAFTSETAAVVLEPVQGEGGVRVADPHYLRAARDLAHDHGALLVLDEIQSGLGRTGTFVASTQANVVPDMVTMAKGVAGGLPVGVCAMTQEVAVKLPPGGHGSTYGGNPMVCAVGTQVLSILDEEKLMARATRLGALVRQRIAELNHPAIRAVHGAGLMVGIELKVRPQGALKSLQERGFLCLAGGNMGLRILPPLTIEQVAIERFLDVLPECLP